MGCCGSHETKAILEQPEFQKKPSGNGPASSGVSSKSSRNDGTTNVGVLPESTTHAPTATHPHHGSSHSHPSLTIHSTNLDPSSHPSPLTINEPNTNPGTNPSDGSLPASNPPFRSNTSTSANPNSLAPPGAEPTTADLTASAKKRSSMRTAGQSKREIPPKSPVIPIRKVPAIDRAPLDATTFPHATGAQSANAHAGHHGYGPGNLSGENLSVDADASTQKIHSDTANTVTTDSPADAAVNASHHHHHSTGVGSTKSRKKLRRQTSHKGLLSRLALQFPLIKASFQKVHNVFERYHMERVQLLMAQQAKQRREAMAAANGTGNKVSDASPTSPTSDSQTGPDFVSPTEAVDGVAATSSSALPASQSLLDSSHQSTRQRKLTQQYLSEEISLDKLAEVLQHISGTSKTFTDEEVRQLFQLADLDGNKTISFREFLIAVSIGYFLKVDESAFAILPDEDETTTAASADSSGTTATATTTATSSTATTDGKPIPVRRFSVSSSLGSDFSEIRRGFKVVEKAFQDIDEDNSNSVDVSELKKALFATSQTKDQSLLELRFQELDFNGDGDINFPEFMYGMTSWVGYMDDEDRQTSEPAVPTK